MAYPTDGSLNWSDDLKAYIDAGAGTLKEMNDQTGTTYTFVLTDGGKWVTFDNDDPVTVTVPPESSVAFPVGTVIEGRQKGAGQVTFEAGVGVTLDATPGLNIAAQHGSYGLVKEASDLWVLIGRLSA